MTRDVFGTYIHTYKFHEGVTDGVILDLKYEARDVPQRLTSQAAIDRWFEQKTMGLNKFQKALVRKRWATMEKLMSAAALVLTDSGGIQEETTILKVPCLTLRNTTERPITVEVGSNRVIGTDPQRIVAAYKDFRAGQRPPMQTPDLWDGRAAQRITEILVNELG